MQGDLYITGDPEADELLNTDPLALLIGMLLDQQVPMEWAFGSPLEAEGAPRRHDRRRARSRRCRSRSWRCVFKGPPALHRFPGSMAKRTQQLCQHLVEHYGGRAERCVDGVADGQELFDRLKPCPATAARRPRSSWPCSPSGSASARRAGRRRRAPFSDDTRRSVADVDSAATLLEVRAFKKR